MHKNLWTFHKFICIDNWFLNSHAYDKTCPLSTSFYPLYHQDHLKGFSLFFSLSDTIDWRQLITDTCIMLGVTCSLFGHLISGCGWLHPWNPNGCRYALSSWTSLIKWCSWISATHGLQISLWWWLVKRKNMILLVCPSGWIIRIYEVLTDVDLLYRIIVGCSFSWYCKSKMVSFNWSHVTFVIQSARTYKAKIRMVDTISSLLA